MQLMMMVPCRVSLEVLVLVLVLHAVCYQGCFRNVFVRRNRNKPYHCVGG